MPNVLRRSALVAASLVTAACASATRVAAQSDSAPRPAKSSKRLDRNVITRDDMLKGDYSSAYDAVAAMRSMWLRPRASESQSDRGAVRVYIDGVSAGGVEALQTIQPRLISTLRYYDGPSATARWGVDHAAGVIHVSTWRDGAPGAAPSDSSRRPARPASPR